MQQYIVEVNVAGDVYPLYGVAASPDQAVERVWAEIAASGEYWKVPNDNWVIWAPRTSILWARARK